MSGGFVHTNARFKFSYHGRFANFRPQSYRIGDALLIFFRDGGVFEIGDCWGVIENYSRLGVVFDSAFSLQFFAAIDAALMRPFLHLLDRRFADVAEDGGLLGMGL